MSDQEPRPRRPPQRQGPPAPRAAPAARERSAQRPAERGRTTDPPAARGLHRAARGRRRRLRQPRAARPCCATSGIHGRDAAFTTELVYGALRMHGLVRRRHRRRCRPGRSPRSTRTCSTRCGSAPTSCWACGSPPTPRSTRRSALARKVNGAGAAGFVNAVHAPGQRADLRRVAGRGRADRRRPGRAPGASSSRHPEWIVKALRGALLGHGASPADTGRRRADRPARDRQRARQGHARGPARAWPRSTELVEARRRAARRSSRVGAVLAGGRPGRHRRGARRSGRGAGRGLASWSRSRWPRVAGRRAPDRAAGSTCAPGPAARRGCSPALAVEAGADLVANEVSRAPGRPGAPDAATGRAGPSGRSHGRGAHAATGGSVGEDEPAALRPGAGRRAVHRAGRAAPATGGALASHSPADLADLGRLQRELLASAIDATAPGGVDRLCDVQPAPGRDARSSCGT